MWGKRYTILRSWGRNFWEVVEVLPLTLLATGFIGIIFFLLYPLWEVWIQYANAGGIDLGKVSFFDKLNSFWSFLQALGVLIAFLSLLLARREILEGQKEYVEGKNREKIKFKADMDPLVVPEPIQNFYLHDDPLQRNFLTLNVVAEDVVVNSSDLNVLEREVLDKSASPLPEKLMRTSWYETVFDIHPANDSRVKYHAIFFIRNLRKGIANNVSIEICNGRVRDHQIEYDFISGDTIYEGQYYDLIEHTPIVLFKDEKYGSTVRFDRNFAIRITYTSHYTQDETVEVYEAEVATGKYFVLDVNNDIFDHRDQEMSHTAKRVVDYDANFIHTQRYRVVKLAFIRLFNKITYTEKDGVYFSRQVKI